MMGNDDKNLIHRFSLQRGENLRYFFLFAARKTMSIDNLVEKLV